MSCASEGAVDVYVEPHLPPRVLLVAGFTPVASALARVGALLDGYRIVRVVEESEVADACAAGSSRVVALPALREFLRGLDPPERAALVAVVATQGHYDEPVLEALLAEEMPPYVGLLASRRRASEVFEVLERRGIARKTLERVCNPVGLDIGARRPGDVAVAVLAEIIETAAASEPQAVRPESLVDELAADPVCAMDVAVASSAQIEYEGQRYYFCGARCHAAFAADPQSYAVAAHA
jgi:xanthine dehydrogenase accessory factor